MVVTTHHFTKTSPKASHSAHARTRCVRTRNARARHARATFAPGTHQGGWARAWSSCPWWVGGTCEDFYNASLNNSSILVRLLFLRWLDWRRSIGRRSSESLRASSKSAWTLSSHDSSLRRRERGSRGIRPRLETVQASTTLAGGGGREQSPTQRIPPGGGTTTRPRPRGTSSFQRGGSLRRCSCRWWSTFFAASAYGAAY
jgi:hypothetical protein